MNFYIIGLGQIGKSILSLIKNKQNSAIYIEDIDGGEFIRGNFEVSAPDMIFLCVPSTELKSVCARVSQSFKKDSLVVILSKGASETGETPAEVASNILGDHRVAVLAGPMLGDEILNGKRSYATCGVTYDGAYEEIFDVFVNTNLLLEKSDDIFGVSAYSVLKNIYTVGYGIVASIEDGDNVRGAYISDALSEMKYVAERIYMAKGETFTKKCSIGDMIATSMHPQSHNFMAGKAIAGMDNEKEIKSEGLSSISGVMSRVGDMSRNTPIMVHIAEIVAGNKLPESLIDLIGVNSDKNAVR